MAFDYSVVRDRKYYNAVKGPCKFILRLALRIKHEGLENVPKDGSFILACNHIHFVDPAVLLAYFPRPIHFMAKEEACVESFFRIFAFHFGQDVGSDFHRPVPVIAALC